MTSNPIFNHDFSHLSYDRRTASPFPYEISAEEFEEDSHSDDYGIDHLLYFGWEHILTNEDGEPIDDPERLVGSSALMKFAAMDTDAVFIRNERQRMSYEIIFQYNNKNGIGGSVFGI